MAVDRGPPHECERRLDQRGIFRARSHVVEAAKKENGGSDSNDDRQHPNH